MDQTKFQKGSLLDLCAGSIDISLRKTWKLNQNAVLALGLQDWFSDTKLIDALAQHFDRLLKDGLLVDINGVGAGSFRCVDANQERCAALQIQTELHLAGGGLLNLVQNGPLKFSWSRSLNIRKIFCDVVRADGGLQRKILVGCRFLAGALDDRGEIGVFIGRKFLEHVDLVAAFGRV